MRELGIGIVLMFALTGGSIAYLGAGENRSLGFTNVCGDRGTFCFRAVVEKREVAPEVAVGAKHYNQCASCHGANGEGNKALNAPKLINQQDWYMVRQLKGFKEGLRGTHPKDVYGMRMRPMSMTLTDDEAINNVVSYIVTFK